jgi:hypothetical protein
MSQPLRGWFDKLVSFLRDSNRQQQSELTTIHAQLNSQVQGVGDPIASAQRIQVAHPIHHVTGTEAIDVIDAPPAFSGPIWLASDGAWSLTTAGNIAAAVTAVVGHFVQLVYDPATMKWYPAN